MGKEKKKRKTFLSVYQINNRNNRVSGSRITKGNDSL